MITKDNRLLIIIFGAASLLLIPFFAMQFTEEVKWGAFDFVIAGILLVSTGIACEMMLRRFRKTSQRIAAIMFVLFVCFLVWAELAVGIFGSPIAGS